MSSTGQMEKLLELGKAGIERDYTESRKLIEQMQATCVRNQIALAQMREGIKALQNVIAKAREASASICQ